MHTDLPFVSVIIPVHDDGERLAVALQHLSKQSYPRERFEVLVVDNLSRHPPVDVCRAYGAVLLTENRRPNADLARNTGIRHARGDVLAFTDADCRPDAQWIEQGVAVLHGKPDVSLAGGAVVMLFPPRPGPAHFADAVTFLNPDPLAAPFLPVSANLFVRRRVFDDVGLFPNAGVSGGETAFALLAMDRGFRTCHAPTAVVMHPARPLVPLLRKAFRIGYGIPEQSRYPSPLANGIAAYTRRIFHSLRPSIIQDRLRTLHRVQAPKAFLPLIALLLVVIRVEMALGIGVRKTQRAFSRHTKIT